MNIEKHIKYLREAVEVSKESRDKGNTPFGAVLVDADGKVVLKQGNAEGDTHDATAHAELTLASKASKLFDKKYLWNCTLYTTVEPCPMCTGGIYWANIGTIVYGLSEERLLDLTGSDDKNPTFNMGAEKIIAAGQKDIKIIGPIPEVEKEIVGVHKDFWNKV